MTAAVQPKARARYAAKRDAIMAAATTVFNDHGVSGFTLAAVAKRMDLHPVSLTYYFKRKEDLAAAVLHETMARFNAMLEQAEVHATPAARLRAFVAAYYETRRRVALGQEIPLAPFSEISLIEGEQHQPLIDAFTGLYIRIGRLMKSPDMPWITPARRQALSRLVVFQLTWSDTWLESYEPEDYGRVAARIADVMINGLAGEGQVWPDLPLLPLGSPVAQNDEVTRDRFLVAATKLINREGYRGASVDKISAALNVTKGSFYHHNDAKEDLVVACFDRTFEVMRRVQRLAMGLAGDQWLKLTSAAAALAEYQLSEYGPLLRTTALSALPEAIREEQVAHSNRVSDRFASMISDGISEGSIRPVDPFIAAQMLNATLNAGAELGVWVAGVTQKAAPSVFARPLLMGIFAK